MSTTRNSAVVAFIWALSGVAGGHIIRLVSNLLLTRLLFPEMFGVMAIVNAIVTGITMFSDIGLREGVLHSARVGDVRFMNTAWTLQLVRGLLVYFVIALAALPLENFYGIQGLAQLLWVVALASVTSAFLPVRVVVQEKGLALKVLAVIELSAQILGALCMVLLAYFTQSIWSLVAGAVCTATLKPLLSALFIKGPRSRLAFESAAAIELWRFGRWIFLSTAGLFVVSQGDRLFLGSVLTPEVLGVYSIAIVFSMLISETAEVIAVKYLSPLYRRLRDESHDFNHAIVKVRRLGLLAGFLVCFGLTQIGDWLIYFLYDERYEAAGGLLQVLAVGAFFRLMDATLRPLFMVYRDSFSSMVYQAIKGASYIGGMIIGWQVARGEGLLVAIALTPLLSYLILLVFMLKHHYKAWSEELLVIAMSLLMFLGAWSLLDTFPFSAAIFLGA